MVKTSEGKIYDMASINARNTPQKESVPLITLDDVKLDLESGAGKVNILKGINLKICAGDSVSIVGPSGAGKTSLLMVIAGIEAISSGKILVSKIVKDQVDKRIDYSIEADGTRKLKNISDEFEVFKVKGLKIDDDLKQQLLGFGNRVPDSIQPSNYYTITPLLMF